MLSLSQRTLQPTDSQADLSAVEFDGSIATAEVIYDCCATDPTVLLDLGCMKPIRYIH